MNSKGEFFVRTKPYIGHVRYEVADLAAILKLSPATVARLAGVSDTDTDIDEAAFKQLRRKYNVPVLRRLHNHVQKNVAKIVVSQMVN